MLERKARPALLERQRSDVREQHGTGLYMPELPGSERWLPVPGYAAWYEASDRGAVFSLGRAGTRGGLLIPQLNSRGYRVVLLCKYGRVATVTVGSIVLRTFRGPPASGQRARHGPGGKADDSLANLRWGLAACFRRRGYRHQLNAQLTGSSFEMGLDLRVQAGVAAGAVQPEPVDSGNDVLQCFLAPVQALGDWFRREGHGAS
jgi:NUMOD4 motif